MRADEITCIVGLLALVAACGSVTGARPDGGTGLDSGAAASGGKSGVAGIPGTSGAAGGGGAGGAAGASGTAGASGVAGSTSSGGAGAGGATATGGAGGGLQLGPNLITNTSFDAGATGWSFTPQAAGYGTATTNVSGGQFCATLTGDNSGAVATIGWPAANASGISLPAGTMFEFSFEASSSQSLQSFLDKVGGAVTDSTDFQSTTDVVTSTMQSFTHTFTSGGDSDAGVAFVFSSSTTVATTVCIANVKLRQIE